MAEDSEGDVPYIVSHKSRKFRIITEDHSADPRQGLQAADGDVPSLCLYGQAIRIRDTLNSQHMSK